jgi:hypothetical protein
MRADRIMVVKDGAIIEDGSHSELLKLKGKYHKLWTSQFLSNPDESDTAVESLNSDSTSCVIGSGKIVNDLDPETKKAEISKLEHGAEHGQTTEDGGDKAEVSQIKDNGGEILTEKACNTNSRRSRLCSLSSPQRK